MSGFSTPGAVAPEPKLMSSRLANMKFMQRAAMSRPSDSPKYPASEPRSKRRKIDTHSRNSTPRRSGDSTPLSHFAARVVEERASQATSIPAREGEDTEWVLDVHVPQANGHNEGSDSSDDDIWSTKTTGRQTFGGFIRHKTAPAKPFKDDADADLSSASEGEASDCSPPRQSKGGKDRFFSKQPQRQASDSASPLRLHAKEQERKRKKAPTQPSGRKKARRTM